MSSLKKQVMDEIVSLYEEWSWIEFWPKYFEEQFGRPEVEIVGALKELDVEGYLRPMVFLRCEFGHLAWKGRPDAYAKERGPKTCRDCGDEPLGEIQPRVSFTITDSWLMTLKREPE